MRLRRPVARGAVRAMGRLALAGLVLAACGGGADRSPLAAGAFEPGQAGRRPTTAVEAALASVKDTPITRAFVEFGDLAEIRPLVRHGGKVWELVGGMGALGLIEVPINLKALTSVDVNKVSTAVTVGDGVDLGVRLSGPGIDPARVTAALERHGAHREGRFLAIGKAGSGAADFRRAYGLLDRSIAGTDYVAVGRTDRAAAAAAGGGKPLTDDPRYAAAGACLRNALWAIVLPVSRFGGKPSSELLALGGLIPRSDRDRPVEEVCLIDRSAAVTAAQAARLRRTLAPTSPFPNPGAAILGGPTHQATVPIRRYVSASDVHRDTVDGVYADRATLTTPRNAGFLLIALESDSIGELYARSCTSKQIDPNLPPARLPALCRAIGLRPPSGP